jgi:hypothetical protein
MAGFLYITEFAAFTPAGAPGGIGQIAQQPELAKHTISLAAGSTQSSAFNINTQFVRLHNDGTQPIAIEFGTNPTGVAAGASGTARMAANQTEYFGVPKDQSFKVAAIIST